MSALVSFHVYQKIIDKPEGDSI